MLSQNNAVIRLFADTKSMCFSFFFKFFFFRHPPHPSPPPTPSLPAPTCLYFVLFSGTRLSRLWLLEQRRGMAAHQCSVGLWSYVFCLSEAHLVTAICQRKLSWSCGKNKGTQWLHISFMSSCWPDKISYSNIFPPKADILQWGFALVSCSSITDFW